MRSRSTRPRVDSCPDYDSLIWVLTYLRRPLDHVGETVLSRTEARKIRACGFQARAGCIWRCPLLPDELVLDNPMLGHLAAGYDQFYRSRKWNPKRAQPLHRYQPPTLTTIETRILNLLGRTRLGRLAKRALQQRLWRYPASFLNHVLKSLALKGYLEWKGPWIYCTSGASPQI